MIRRPSLAPKRILALAIVIAAGATTTLSYLAPLYPYEWTGEPGLAQQADPDTVLFATFLSGIGVFLATIGAALSVFGAGRSWPMSAAAITVLLLAAYRFSAAVPLYTG